MPTHAQFHSDIRCPRFSFHHPIKKIKDPIILFFKRVALFQFRAILRLLVLCPQHAPSFALRVLFHCTVPRFIPPGSLPGAIPQCVFPTSTLWHFQPWFRIIARAFARSFAVLAPSFVAFSDTIFSFLRSSEALRIQRFLTQASPLSPSAALTRSAFLRLSVHPSMSVPVSLGSPASGSKLFLHTFCPSSYRSPSSRSISPHSASNLNTLSHGHLSFT
ncbi:hypothetical protein TRVL_05800 [Trypanosoma vivax]|nr:hypothetical protein TRVL_05800 [Trypanosoma vivax]